MGILVLIILFLVIMPALLYLVGWSVARYTTKMPSWIGFPVRLKEPSDEPGGPLPAKIKE